MSGIQKQVKRYDADAVVNFLEGGFDSFELDDETFSKMFDSAIKTIKEDELVNGKIVNITKDEVFVDIGFKSLGVVPKAELLNAETYKIGDEIDVFIEKMEDSSGKLLLSRRRADFMRIWEDIIALFDKQEVTKVKILRRIKGGMVVDLLGIEAFLPGSQIDVRPVRDFDGWVSKTIDVKVVKVNHPSENVVVSHKVLLEEQLSEQRNEIMSRLEKGLVLEGTVKAISDFGVFVDLGGVDGLVHITDLSWGRVTHPSEIVSLDEVVKIVVLDFDGDKKRISLGMKQLTPHPWDTIGDKYEKSTKVTGKVVSLTDYGAFIEIEKGIEGLIHISEMSWTQHVKHPSQIVSMGQVVDAMVLNIDKDNKKLALGMKQLDPDPWEDLMKKYPVESKHNGIVRNLTNFGVFVELEPGVDGLVHISDLSWTKKIRHPGEFVKKGDRLEVMVLSIDPEQRRIALGHKQINSNPWDTFETTYSIGQESEAKIERIIEKGVIVELPEGVDGFVPVSQLSFAPVKNISEYFKIGDMLPLKVVEFDKEAKKIVLSVVEALRNKDKQIIDDYNRAHPVPNADSAPMEVTYDSSEASFFSEEYNLDYKKLSNEDFEGIVFDDTVVNKKILTPKGVIATEAAPVEDVDVVEAAPEEEKVAEIAEADTTTENTETEAETKDETQA
ncbi:MAG: 30S ribosomal protein S1 [Candidatus Kapabacteria bacterium]|nr:30S ribosomal protein S1 [Ignavibacteriota bacterium]MCW5885838.1 30S ribosomal protein S1 [Candidatus Kapabacteria bacterium]